MKNNDVLNIVQIGVTDTVGSTSSNWDLAFVFYADGTVGIRTLDEAKEIAKDYNLQIRKDDGKSVANNYKKYRTVPCFNPYAITPVEDDNAKQKGSGAQNQDDSYSDDEKDNLFLWGAKKVGGFLSLPFVFGYGVIGKFCDWANNRVLSRVNKFLSKRKKNKRKKGTKSGVVKKIKQLFSDGHNQSDKKDGLVREPSNKAEQARSATTMNFGQPSSANSPVDEAAEQARSATTMNFGQSSSANSPVDETDEQIARRIIDKIKGSLAPSALKDEIVGSIMEMMDHAQVDSGPKVHSYTYGHHHQGK